MLLDWLRDEGRRFRARIYDLGVIDDALPGYHDYAVNLTVGRVRYDGRGQARTAALALSKATGEAVERWLVDRCRRRGELETSSGLAVHTTARRARDNARRELIERDLFLCHLLTGTPFNPVPRRELETNAAIVHFERQCASIGIELRYGALPSEADLQVVICAAFGRDHRPGFGVLVGFGTHRRIDAACEKATLECWATQFSVRFLRPSRPLSRSAFLRRRAIDIDDHFRFACHDDARRMLLPFFRASDPVRIARRVSPRVATRLWERLPPPFESCPLVGARCTSDALQPLFFGVPRADEIHARRLDEFCLNRGLPRRRRRGDCIHVLT